MHKRIRKSARSSHEIGAHGHRFEHWYVDNQAYFITARCRDRFPAFADEPAKTIFWDRFDYHAETHGFEPWCASLLDNHYHAIGYVRVGINLKRFIQRLHGSVAKLVNDLLPERREHFWRDDRGHEYFDGCLRDEIQTRRAWWYTLRQSERHGITADYRTYPHTRIWVDLEPTIDLCHACGAFMQHAPYPRYSKRKK